MEERNAAIVPEHTMSFSQISFNESIIVSGLSTQLTRSQNENFKIITSIWKEFNAQLSKYKLQQQTSHWEKYGITYKTGDDYFYLAAIPFKKGMPPHFVTKLLPEGEYLIFKHNGEMVTIKETISKIYREILPASEGKLMPDKKAEFFHFEKYDRLFKWNNPTSVVLLYLPIDITG